jgi:perosamine synthetase
MSLTADTTYKDWTPTPVRADFLPFHRPSIGEEEIGAVADVLRSGWLTTGPRTREFEEGFARFVGAPYAVAVNSGTAALHLALEACGVRAGDEVIVPAITFAATAEVVVYLGAKPVIVDCLDDTMNLDPAEIERARSPRTRAVIPVHLAGLPCDMNRILASAGDSGLTVIEDAAHALPASYGGRTIGTLSDFTCFSFYATKTLTTGEGGMLTTANADGAERARMMSLHGLSRPAWNRYAAPGAWFYEVLEAGYKYNLTDPAAALGLVQLGRCVAFRDQRRSIANRYVEAFTDLPEIRLPPGLDDPGHALHLFVIRLQPDRLTINRDQFIQALAAQNVGSSVHFIPLHLHPYYRDRFGYRPDDNPRATAIFQTTISLPIYPGMSTGDVDDVILAVRNIVQRYRR